MNLVTPSLRRPITVIVLVVAIAAGAVLALRRMPRDIFPTLGIPTIYVAQPYGGMDPAQMEGYLTYYYEYHFLYITGIEHVESKSIQGAAIIKLQFHPGTDMSQAMSETVAYVNRARAFMPPGTVPPFIMRFDAGIVPVGNLAYALVNGRRTVYIPVTKRSDASTLAVVNLVKENLPKFQGVLPDDVKVSYEFDQSPVVIRAIKDLAREVGGVHIRYLRCDSSRICLTSRLRIAILKGWKSLSPGLRGTSYPARVGQASPTLKGLYRSRKTPVVVLPGCTPQKLQIPGCTARQLGV